MSRISGLPTAGKSHRGLEAPSAVGETFPTSLWLVTREGQPAPLRVPLPVRAAQLFPRGILMRKQPRGKILFRVGILMRELRQRRRLHEQPTRKKLYDRLKIYRVTPR